MADPATPGPAGPPASPATGPGSGPVAGQLVDLARDIKLSHTVFALPFAALGAVLAAAHRGAALRWTEAVLVAVCMVTARTYAMTHNRLADARLDAANPRTAGRAVASGRVTRRTAGLTLAGCAAGFFAAAAGFWFAGANPWPLVLSPFVLAWLTLYSYTKRFTALCHLVLGVALALSPLAAAVAVDPAYLAHAPAWCLAAMVAGWVAGFDVLYALQDAAHDRKAGLFSLPARIGNEPALWISRLLHVLAVIALVLAWHASPRLHTAFGAVTAVVAALLIVEHALVWRSKLNRLNLAFFAVNGVISLLLGVAGVLDVLTV